MKKKFFNFWILNLGHCDLFVFSLSPDNRHNGDFELSYLLLFLSFLLCFKCFRVEPSSSDIAAYSEPDFDRCTRAFGSVHGRSEHREYYIFYSLEGELMDWFLTLSRDDLSSFDKIKECFLTKYQHKIESKPTFHNLSRETMKSGEEWVTFANRWWEMVARLGLDIPERQVI